jgi:hypothetical protein
VFPLISAKYHIDLKADELGGALGLSLIPAIFDGDGATLVPTEFVQSLDKGGRPRTTGRGIRAQESDDWKSCLLRARRERHSNATTLTLLRNVMNSRRLMGFPPRRELNVTTLLVK